MARTKKPATEGLNGALAQTIKGELAARGMTREELSTRSGVPVDSVKNYLSPSPARARVMDVEVVASIAAGLGMTTQALVSLAEQRLAEQRLAEQRLAADQAPSHIAPTRADDGPDKSTTLSADQHRRVYLNAQVGKSTSFLRALAESDDPDAELEGMSPALREHVLKVREELAQLDAAVAAERASS